MNGHGEALLLNYQNTCCKTLNAVREINMCFSKNIITEVSRETGDRRFTIPCILPPIPFVALLISCPALSYVEGSKFTCSIRLKGESGHQLNFLQFPVPKAGVFCYKIFA